MTIKSLQCLLNTMQMIPWYSYWQTEGVYTLTVHVSSDVDPHWLPLPIRIRILDPYRPPYGSGSRSSSIIGVVRIRKKCSYKANLECKPSIQRYSTVSYLIFFFMFFTLFWRFFLTSGSGSACSMRFRIQEASQNSDPCQSGSTSLHGIWRKVWTESL